MSIKLGLIGLGTVGQGVVQILQRQAERLSRQIGQEIVIKSVCVRDPEKSRDIDLNGYEIVADPAQIVADPEIDIVVELMGGLEPAKTLIETALKSGKSVVTANKMVISKFKTELSAAEAASTGFLYYEAAVAGGVPIINAFKTGLIANTITGLDAILNGTTNYILTQIESTQRSFDDVLAEAQQLGFAEADPTLDLNGNDAAHKLIILASDAFGVRLAEADLAYEGIVGISLRDIQVANEFGYRIKLLAIGRRVGETSVSFKLHPTMIPKSHPLASVNNENNAVYLVGDAAGEQMMYGRGAGRMPTASAVVSDIVTIASGKARKTPAIENDLVVIPQSETTTQFYIRMKVADTVGVLEKIAAIFGRHQVSILRVLQSEVNATAAELIIVTHLAVEKNMMAALDSLKQSDAVHEIHCVIRVGLGE